MYLDLIPGERTQWSLQHSISTDIGTRNPVMGRMGIPLKASRAFTSVPHQIMHLLDLPLELLIHVLSSLPISHMRSLMLVNTGWRWLVQRFLSRKYHLALLPYLKDPSSFRDVLRRSHSVISGSFALEFSLHGTTRPPINVGDIDIYAGVANSITIIEHLRREEGYLAIPLSILPCISYIDDYDGGIAAVVRMLHPRGTKIDVICSSRISALHPITFFWSTAVMSFLTADGFCSAYHALTERGIACLNPSRDLTPRIRRCMTKYERRGFKIGNFDINEVCPNMSYQTALCLIFILS